MDTITDDFFISIDQSFDLRKIDHMISEPILVEDRGYELVFLTSSILKKSQIDGLRRFLSITAKRPVAIKILYVLTLDENKEKKNLDYYNKNSIDLSKHIKRGEKVVTLGKTLYSVIHSKALHPTKAFNLEGFQDVVFNESFFWAPVLGCYVFPLESMRGGSSWLRADGFDNFFAKHQIREALTPRRLPRDKPLKIVHIKTAEEALKIYTENKALEWISLDTETSGLDFTVDRVGCITFALNSSEGYYLSWDTMKETQAEFEAFIGNKKQIYANAQFDIKMLAKNGIERDKLYCSSDVVALAQIVNELQRNSLKASVWLFTNYGGYDKPLDDYRVANKMDNYLDIPEDILIPYATKDAILTFALHEKFMQKIREIDKEHPLHTGWSLERYYTDVRIPAINTFTDIEYRGMDIDVSKVEAAEKQITEEIAIVRADIYKALNLNEDTFNINSSKQLGQLLQERGYEQLEVGAKGQYLTKSSNIINWINLGHKEIEPLLKYRELNTLLKTFIGKKAEKTGFYQYIKNESTTPTMHSSFHTMLTHSHRNRSSQPNAQNFPKQGSNAKLIRSYFKPPKDYFIGEWDAAGLQLRVHAVLSKDAVMAKAFIEHNGDLHSITAHALFKKDVTLEYFLERIAAGDKEYKALRNKAKPSNFSLIFNTTAFSFAKSILELQWTFEECKQYVADNNLEGQRKRLSIMVSTTGPNRAQYSIEENDRFAYYWAAASYIKKEFFNLYSTSKTYIAKRIAKAREQGFVRSPFGPIRRLPQLLKVGKQDNVKSLENKALNSPVQTHEAVLMMDAITNMHNEIKEMRYKSQIVGNVHDSCVMYIHKTEVELVKDMVHRHFEKVREINGDIPFEATIEIGDYDKGEYWGFGKEFKVYEVA